MRYIKEAVRMEMSGYNRGRSMSGPYTHMFEKKTKLSVS